MKTIQKIFLLVVLSGGFLISSSFSASTSKNLQIITEPGVYKTSDDFLKHHLTQYDAISVSHNSYKGILNGKKVPSMQYKDADFWGIQNDNGIVYRINKKVNVACQIITNANICYYAGTELVVKKNDDGSLKSISVNPETGAHFSDIFWVSKGIDGELLGASEDNLSKLFADSPELIAKMKEKGISETDSKIFLDNFNNVADWVREYDKVHK